MKQRRRVWSRVRIGRHAVAGLVVGLVATTTALALSNTAPGRTPMSAAARTAALAAGAYLTSQPDAHPAAAPWERPQAPEANPIEFAGGAPLRSTRYAERLVVRSVGIDVPVTPVGVIFAEGRLQYDVPRQEAGQYVGTGQPGRAGNTVIGGHVSRRGQAAVFSRLPKIAAGDVVEVYRAGERYRYSVTEIRVVASDATDVMSQTQDATLTLITCFPDDQLRDRLVVVGKLL